MTPLADVRLEDGSTQQAQLDPPGGAGGGVAQPSVSTGTGAAQITCRSAAYTPTGSGNLTVTVAFSGTDATVDDPLTFQLVRNPTALTGAPGGTLLGLPMGGASSHVGGHWAFTLPFAEHQPVGVPVQYGMTVTGTGASAAVNAMVSITEGPAV